MDKLKVGFLHVRIVLISPGDLRWNKPIGEVVVDILNPPFKWDVLAEKKLAWKVVE